jgi:hypothetical protein
MPTLPPLRNERQETLRQSLEGVEFMKKILIILVAVIVLSVPVAVYAASVNSETAKNMKGSCSLGVDTADLTEQQKEDLEETFNQMVEVRKESISKMVENGLMSKEEADAALEQLNEMIEYHEENGYGMGMGMGMMKGSALGHGKMGRKGCK